MTGFCEAVGHLRMCSNHVFEMRRLRSVLVTCDGAVRLPSSFVTIMQCTNPAA